jgi:hypothetical protein
MKEYFSWHQEQVLLLNETNWDKSHRYLVMRCLEIDGKCGGTSDRLKVVPFAIMLAAQTKRLLFIKWERPTRLQEFLVPPQGGMNWTIPEWLDARLKFGRQAAFFGGTLANRRTNSTNMLVDMRFQADDHGSAQFNQHKKPEAGTFDEIYHDVWSILFEPAPPVAKLIEEYMTNLGLVKNQYVSLHIRSMYTSDSSNNMGMVQNGVNCASQIMPGAPIYVASDSRNASVAAVQYGKQVGGRVVTRLSEKDPLHIDRGINFLTPGSTEWKDHQASDFYDIFVDLYLLAGGKCTAFNIGGYGRWANVLSQDLSCAIDHRRNTCKEFVAE